MDKAKIFEKGNERIVSAWDIRNGIETREHDFVDPEEDFRVKYVKASKNNGAPYFRLYLSREDYLSFTRERLDRYEILSKLHHFAESKWHRDWEEYFREFASIEKYIKNKNTGKYKRADAFCEYSKTVIEFQHSYIAYDFQDRNSFYTDLNYNVIWLFDLTSFDVIDNENEVKILEDNKNGFFRVAEEELDFSNNLVFIQAKNKKIYKVNKLFRKEIDNTLKSTVRYFDKTLVLSPDEFLLNIKNNAEWISKPIIKSEKNVLKTIFQIWSETNDGKRSKIIVQNIENGNYLKLIKDKDGFIREIFETGCLSCLYCGFDAKTQKYFQKSYKFYCLSKEEARQRIWRLCEVK